MRVLQAQEVKAVAGAGLLTNFLVGGSKVVVNVGTGLVKGSINLFRFLI